MYFISKYKYIRGLKKLQKAKSSVTKNYEQVISEKKNNSEKYSELQFLAQEEHRLDCYIDLYKTDYFKKLSEKLIISMPENHDDRLYFEHDFDDEYGPRQLLTTAGYHQVINSVRLEQKRRREIVGFWFAFFIGIIGATTGLISIIKL